MEFTKFSAGTYTFGTGETNKVGQLPNVNFTDPRLEEALAMWNSEEKQEKNEYNMLKHMLYAMALCHTIVIDTRKGSYSASSPDELALVNAAKQFGFEFSDIDADDNYIIKDKITGETHKFKKLSVCEFNSTRKRMSVIFEYDCPKKKEKKIWLVCKGADSIIDALLEDHDKAGDKPTYLKNKEFVDKVANEGLRTLFVASRVIEKKEFDEWHAKKIEAMNKVTNREEEVAKVDALIEKNMCLLGTTAIEDRLQD